MVLSDGECSLETGVNVLKQGSPTPGFLLGTGSHSRRWAVGNWLKLHPYLEPLPTAHITAWAMPPVRSVVAWWMQCAWIVLNHPPTILRKNSLPQNQSLVQKTLGTAVLKNATLPVTPGLAAIHNYGLHQQILGELTEKEKNMGALKSYR